MVGKNVKVLMTEKGKEDTYIGRTMSYKPVVVREGVTLGVWADVKITASAPTHLFGTAH